MSDSTVVAFIRIVYRNATKQNGYSWTILNRALHQSLVLAIENGFEFEEGDFAAIHSEFNGGYWFGNSDKNFCGEGLYSIAALGGGSQSRYDLPNKSACISFEKWVQRKPFILNGNRLAVQSVIEIAGKRYFVTSFAKDNSFINIGGYHSAENPHGWQKGSPAKRFHLTHAEVKLIGKGKFTLQ